MNWLSLLNYDKDPNLLKLDGICLTSKSTNTSQTKILGDFSKDLLSIFGILISNQEILISLFSEPELDLSLNALHVNLFSPRLLGGDLQEIIVDFYLPFLASQNKQLAFF